MVPEYIQALSLTCNRDIMVTFDLTCDLLSKNPSRRCAVLLLRNCKINAMQLIDKQTKVTDTLHSLLDVIMVSDPALAKGGEQHSQGNYKRSFLRLH